MQYTAIPVKRISRSLGAQNPGSLDKVLGPSHITLKQVSDRRHSLYIVFSGLILVSDRLSGLDPGDV
jgi:hypothetical protein